MTWKKPVRFESPGMPSAGSTVTLIIAGILLCLSSALAMETSYETEHPDQSLKLRKGFKPRHQEGEILVKFRKGASKGTRKALHSRHRSAILRDFSRLDLQLIRLETASVEEAIKKYNADPSVEYAQPNHIGMV